MNKFIQIGLLFLLQSTTTFANFNEGTHNPLRGYSEINRLIVERIAENNGFQIGQYLSGKATRRPSPGSLLSLLGTYNGSDTSGGFSNGDPNSVNMLLWYIDLSLLAEDISKRCKSGALVQASGMPELILTSSFQEILKPLCSWPEPQSRLDQNLFAFWSALMGFDAPPQEFEAWKNYFMNTSDYLTMKPSTVISAMVFAALFNPYFLLAD